ncbi:aspartate/glutamate racemase family protein [Bradyrhizobium diazoefficiens]|nr:aspartate/glutamate racemase family protein [Bradyrhizobium diazoefficiens]MBR0849633.1 aspartate/glutamate racemase family protein [Bradyrhizobium diazoefficiens]
MHVGLIGGIGPAATDFYYRRLIAAFASRKTPLELTIAHADTPTLLKNLASNDQAGQAAIFARLTKRLAVAGANCVAITSIAGHFCIDSFKAVSPLHAVDMIVEVNQAIAERGLNRVGILGTQTVMETRFYGGVTSAEIIAPGGQDLLDVHQAYVTMAASGVLTEAQRSVFDAASHRLLKDKGAEAILLGGTDLVLVYDERTSSFPLIDCASIHADAIARLVIG